MPAKKGTARGKAAPAAGADSDLAAGYYGQFDAADQAALLAARGLKGLEEEIALLRTRLHKVAGKETPDEGLILAAINTLARALMAQLRVKSADPAEMPVHMADVLRQLGTILEEENEEERGT